VPKLPLGDKDCGEVPVALLTGGHQLDALPLVLQALEAQLEAGFALELQVEAPICRNTDGLPPLFEGGGLQLHGFKLPFETLAVSTSVPVREPDFAAPTTRVQVALGRGGPFNDEVGMLGSPGVSHRVWSSPFAPHGPALGESLK
jgi:hypothetical protein